jgi:hypothetical protein
MPDEASNLKIDQDTYVNEATLELLQRRIEADVRSGFLKTVTLPIGGGGILAILVAVFLWVPQKVESFLKDPSVQKMVDTNLQDQIDDYFSRADTKKDLEARIKEQTTAQIKEEVTAQLPREVQQAVTAAVRDYFAKEEGQAFVRQEVQEIVDLHLAKKETHDEIHKLVSDYMQTDGRKILVEKVEEILRPAAARVGETISSNRERAVVEFEPQSLQGEEKGTIENLNEYMRKENVDRIRRDGRPVVLTKTIKATNEYAAFAISDYLRRFRQAFGDQFRYIAISWGADNGQERLLALIPSRQFESVFGQRSQDLMVVLNAQKEGAPQLGGETGVRERLAEWFGPDVTRTIPADEKVGRALTSKSVWTTTPRVNDEIAIVDGNGRLTATTTRRRLVDGLFK